VAIVFRARREKVKPVANSSSLWKRNIDFRSRAVNLARSFADGDHGLIHTVTTGAANRLPGLHTSRARMSVQAIATRVLERFAQPIVVPPARATSYLQARRKISEQVRRRHQTRQLLAIARRGLRLRLRMALRGGDEDQQTVVQKTANRRGKSGQDKYDGTLTSSRYRSQAMTNPCSSVLSARNAQQTENGRRPCT